jgi:hypothetical protein
VISLKCGLKVSCHVAVLVPLGEGSARQPIDISPYRLFLGFFLLYTDRVPFELLDSAALV